MCNEKINMTDKYTTKDGRPVSILAVGLKGATFPVLGVVTREDGAEFGCTFTADGREYLSTPSSTDLVKFDPLAKFRNLPVDTPVWVKDTCKGWLNRHFKCVEGSRVCCFRDGRTSHTGELAGTYPWSVDQVSLTKPEGA